MADIDNIPRNHLGPLARLMALPASAQMQLVDAFKAAPPPTLRTSSLAKHVAPSIKEITEDELRGVLQMLTGMYVARIETGLSAEEFADQLCSLAKVAKYEDVQLEPADQDWRGFSERLAAILSCDHSLGVMSKALRVTTDHPHIYCKARLRTDLRPVFGPDPADGPHAGAIVHQLCISYHVADDLDDFFVALDSDDIRKLRDILDRALAKEASLKSIWRKTGIPVLDAELDTGSELDTEAD